jgi:hypothetical protein
MLFSSTGMQNDNCSLSYSRRFLTKQHAGLILCQGQAEVPSPARRPISQGLSILKVKRCVVADRFDVPYQVLRGNGRIGGVTAVT